MRLKGHALHSISRRPGCSATICADAPAACTELTMPHASLPEYKRVLPSTRSKCHQASPTIGSPSHQPVQARARQEEAKRLKKAQGRRRGSAAGAAAGTPASAAPLAPTAAWQPLQRLQPGRRPPSRTLVLCPLAVVRFCASPGRFFSLEQEVELYALLLWLPFLTFSEVLSSQSPCSGSSPAKASQQDPGGVPLCCGAHLCQPWQMLFTKKRGQTFMQLVCSL